MITAEAIQKSPSVRPLLCFLCRNMETIPMFTTTINDLADDTLVEILCRLEALKHIVTCKSVSKSWYNLISTICIPRITSSPLYGLLFRAAQLPYVGCISRWGFACMNTSNQISGSLESCFDPYSPIRPSEDYAQADSIHDCCNGFILFVHFCHRQYYVCNPSTEQYTVIPAPPFSYDFYQNNALIFDPTYKVVHISTSPSPTMNIFCPVTRKWSVCDLDMNLSPLEHWYPRLIFYDGSLYTLSCSKLLLKFDLKQESFQATKFPQIVMTSESMGHLGVFQGRLCYAADDHKSTVKVWAYTPSGDTDAWVLRHAIDFGMLLWSSVVAFHPTADVLFIGDPSRILSYHLETKRLEESCQLRDDVVMHRNGFRVFPFMVNLTPPDAYSQRIHNGQDQRTYKMDDYLSDILKNEHLTKGRHLCGTWKDDVLLNVAKLVLDNTGEAVNIGDVRARMRYLDETYQEGRKRRQRSVFGIDLYTKKMPGKIS